MGARAFDKLRAGEEEAAGGPEATRGGIDDRQDGGA